MRDLVREVFINGYERFRPAHTPLVLVVVVLGLAEVWSVFSAPTPVWLALTLFFSVELIGSMFKQREEEPW